MNLDMTPNNITFLKSVFKKLEELDSELIIPRKDEEDEIIDLILPGEIDSFLSDDEIERFKLLIINNIELFNFEPIKIVRMKD